MNTDFLNKRNKIKALIAEYVDSQKGVTPFYEVINYALGDTGKLVRPMITSLVADSLSLHSHAIERFMISVEMTHVSSLIHDDLPGLDDDNERRGKQSTHIKFSEGVAILAGDYLYAESLKLISQSDLISVHDSAILIDILLDAQKSLNNGQILELNLRLERNKEVVFDSPESQEDLVTQIEKISLLKTGALFFASALAPVKLVGDEILYSEMKKIIEGFSLCFQLRDDILDSKHDTRLDKEYNHINILGYDAAVKYYGSLFQNTISNVKNLGSEFSSLSAFFADILEIPSAS